MKLLLVSFSVSTDLLKAISTLSESVSAISDVKRLKRCSGARKGNVSKMGTHLRSQERFPFLDLCRKDFQRRLANVEENTKAYEIFQGRTRKLLIKLP